jgi:hypothetical protein
MTTLFEAAILEIIGQSVMVRCFDPEATPGRYEQVALFKLGAEVAAK